MGSKPWSPWYTEISPEVGRKSDSLQCSLCGRIFAKRLERQLSHLEYEERSGKRTGGIGLCTKLTSRVHNLFKNCGGHYPKHNGELHSEHCSNPILGDMPPFKQSPPKSNGGNSCIGSTQAPLLISPTPIAKPVPRFRHSSEDGSVGGTIPTMMRQSLISNGFHEVQRRELDKAWAKFFYDANVPFAVAKNATFKEAVMKTAAFKKPYVPPSYHDIRTTLLVQARADLEAQLDKRVAESVRKFGGTLALDGWTSVNSRPLCNAMLVSPSGKLFLGSVDTTGNEKTATYMERFIEQVGPHNIVQVCTDNDRSMLNASKIITEKYPHIYMQGCVAHAMDLLLEDWGKATWIKETVEKAKLLVKFVKKCHMPLAVFRKHEAKFSLLMHGQTRFASHFIMIDRLLNVKEALEQTVVDPQWTAYISKRSRDGRDKARTARTIKTVVLNEHFWDRCTNFQEMVAHVVYALREFDAKEPSMGKVLAILRNLEKHVLALRTESFNLDSDFADLAERQFYARKQMISTDLHSAGALLNPYLLHDEELGDDSDVITACKRVLRNLCIPETYPDVVQEFLAFRHKRAPFHDMLDPKQQKCSPYAWWDFEGACGKLLAPIAKRILVQTVSTSSCERNWSSYSFVHDRKRNRLLPKRADDLVFVYTNSRLLATSKLTDEKRWYAENLDLEDSQPHESDDPEYLDNSSPNGITAYDAEHLDEAINSGTFAMDNIPSASINEHDFENTDDLEDKVDAFLPIAQLLNTDGRVNTPSILHPTSLPTPESPTLKQEEHLPSSHATAQHGHKMAGVSVEHVDGLHRQIPLPMSTLKQTTKFSFVDDTVHLKDNFIMDHTIGGARTMLHCVGNKPPTSTKQPFFKGTSSWSLFRSAPPLVTTTKPTSSNGLLSLSKQVGLQIPKIESDGISSDADVPLSKLFIHNPKVHDGSASRPKPPIEATKKCKLSMRPFAPSPPRNPLDAVQTWKKFKSI